MRADAPAPEAHEGTRSPDTGAVATDGPGR